MIFFFLTAYLSFRWEGGGKEREREEVEGGGLKERQGKGREGKVRFWRVRRGKGGWMAGFGTWAWWLGSWFCHIPCNRVAFRNVEI